MAKSNLLILQRIFLLACFAMSTATVLYGQDARVQELSRLKSSRSVDKSTKNVIRKAMTGEVYAVSLERKTLKQSTLPTPQARVRRISLPANTRTSLSLRKLEIPYGSLNLAREASKYQKEKLPPIAPQQRVIRKTVN